MNLRCFGQYKTWKKGNKSLSLPPKKKIQMMHLRQVDMVSYSTNKLLFKLNLLHTARKGALPSIKL